MLLTMQEYQDLSDSWGESEFMVVPDSVRRDWYMRLSSGAIPYEDRVAQGPILCFGRRMITVDEYAREFVKEGDERTSGKHETLKRRMLAVFTMDDDGHHHWGECGFIDGPEFTHLNPELKKIFKGLEPGSRVTFDRRTFAKTHWYYVWDDEVDI